MQCVILLVTTEVIILRNALPPTLPKSLRKSDKLVAKQKYHHDITYLTGPLPFFFIFLLIESDGITCNNNII